MTTLTAAEWIVNIIANVAVFWALHRSRLRGIIYMYQTFSVVMTAVFPFLYWWAAYQPVDALSVRIYHLTYDATGFASFAFELAIGIKYRRDPYLPFAIAANRCLRAMQLFVEIPHSNFQYITLDIYRRIVVLIVMGLFVRVAYSEGAQPAHGSNDEQVQAGT